MQCYIKNTEIKYPKGIRSTGFNFLLTNNYIYCGHYKVYFSLRVSNNTTVANNIINGGGKIKLKNTHFYNNLYQGSIIDNGDNNIEYNINTGNDFATYYVQGNSPDGKWQLNDTSPAIGAGRNGEDCGMFGGPNTYIISGIPPVPSIIDVSMPTSGSEQSDLPVTITIQSNN